MFQRIKSFLLENKSVKQTVIKNTIWLTGGTILSRTVRALMIIYAARVLGTEGYGIFSYALSLAAFFTIFSDIGLSGLLTRELVKKPNETQRYTSTTFYIKLVITSLGVLFTLFAAPLFIKIDAARPLLPIVAFLLAFDSLRGFTFSITRSKNRMEIESMLSVATDMLITCLGFAALFLLPTPKWLSIAYTAGSGLGLLIAFVVIRKWAGDFIKGFDRTLIKPILSSAWPFAVMGLLGGLMINIDTIIIGWFRSAGELGLYAAAQRPILLFYIVPSLISASIFPIISKFAHEGDHDRTKRVIEQTIVGALAIGIPLIVGGILLGQPFMQFVFGSAYIYATLTFQLLLLTIVPVFAGMIIGNAIFAYDKQKIFLISVGSGAIVNVILDLILIPAYGIAGSAVATIIAQLIANGYVWWKFKEIVDLNVIPKLGKITLASIGMGLAVLSANLLHLHVVLSIVIGVAVYAALIIALKEPLLEVIGWKPKKCIIEI
jgi:O-antigen/teichoic acid export membrane protein